MTTSVLFLHEIASGPGGSERYLELLGATLRRRGVDVNLVVFGQDPTVGAAVTERFRQSFTRAEHIPGASRPWSVWRAIRRYQPDVLHWNFNDPFAFSGALWILLPWAAPSVITDHLPMLRARAHREVPRSWANHHVGAIIVVGPAAARAAQSHWGAGLPLRVIPNGVPVRAGLPRAERVAGQALRLVFVGRLEPQKNPTFLLEVVRVLVQSGHDVHLRIVGDGSMRGALDARVLTLGLEDRVSFAGHCSDPGPELDRADVLLAPSVFEGAPLAPREALASALPVVLSDIEAHRELLVDCSVHRSVPLGSPHAWASAVLSIAGHLGEARAEALAISARFSVDVMTDLTLDTYGAVLAAPRHRRGPPGQR